ncbi:MAG: hypothetical protein J3R72DRAFT_462608, partial [Linnemannia gamsii]
MTPAIKRLKILSLCASICNLLSAVLCLRADLVLWGYRERLLMVGRDVRVSVRHSRITRRGSGRRESGVSEFHSDMTPPFPELSSATNLNFLTPSQHLS